VNRSQFSWALFDWANQPFFTVITTFIFGPYFANVMIGKGKPWIAQLPLADLKPAEADLLVHCATVSAFSANLPPITLVGVLRWAGEAGRLETLHESVSTLVAKSTSRWSGKWTAALRKEVPALPELIAAGLKPEAPEGSDRGESDDVAQPPEDDGRQEVDARRLR